jgi:hypothetical protein
LAELEPCQTRPKSMTLIHRENLNRRRC